MLDKSKPYGEIYGDTQGRRYEQGGKYFSHDGKPWGEPKAKKGAKADEPNVEVEPVVDTTEDDQVAKQLAGD